MHKIINKNTKWMKLNKIIGKLEQKWVDSQSSCTRHSGIIEYNNREVRSETPCTSFQHLLTWRFRVDTSWDEAAVHLKPKGSSSPSSTFSFLPNTHIFASLCIASEFQIIGLGRINFHMFPFHNIVLGLIFQSLRLLIPLLLFHALLFMVFNQLKLFLVICLTSESGSNQSFFIVHCWLPLQEEIDILISKDIHFFIFPHEA